MSARLLIAAALLLSLIGCGLSDRAGADSQNGPSVVVTVLDPALDGQARAILALKCASCHGPDSGGLGGFRAVLDAPTLVSAGYIHIGDSANSKLFLRSNDGTMPPGLGIMPAEIQTIKNWIDRGLAYSGPPSSNSQTISFPAGTPQTTIAAVTLLRDRCYSCHNPSSGDMTGGGLIDVVDPATLLANGMVVRGQASRSPLYQSVRDGHMPKNGTPLSAAEVDMLRSWIDISFPQNPIPLPGYTVTALTPTFHEIRHKILAPRCVWCHGGADGNRGGVKYLDYQTTLETVVAGNPTASRLYTYCKSEEMPKTYNRLTTQELQAISDWISAGAQNN